MNAWPTLREWFQFGSTLALELVVIFAVAKLVSLRLRSAVWRRALWQMSLLAMLLVVVGELNGVRGWLRLPEKKSSPLVEKKVVVTFQDVEPDLEWFRDSLMTEASSLVTTAPKPARRPSRWQQHAVWPVLIWAVFAALILFRLLIAQAMAIALRFTSHRSNGHPCPLDVITTERTGGMAVRSSDALALRAQRLAQTLGIRRPVALLTNSRALAPFTFGAWRPVIVLPIRFSETFTPAQQDAALAHELAHVAGFDSAWRCFSQLACAVLWWHPLVWMAKRELDHASELVADEASLLLADGPDRLAECLVACAKELHRPALTTWLGMDGGGFRSALGQRVARLLQLAPGARVSRPVPWYLRLIAPMLCAALLWMGMAAAIKSGEPRGGAWRSSILGSAFAAAAENKTPALVTPQPTKIEAVSATRTNTTASHPNAISVKRQAVFEKLRSIRLSEWGPLDSLPLSEVIRVLSAETRRLDPDHQGVNFILSGNAVPSPGGVDAAGLPIARTNEPVNLNATPIRLGTKLFNLSAEEVLNILMKIADRKIKYSVEDFGVVISPRGDEPTPLHTRFFHINSNDFQRVLQSLPPELINAPSKAHSDGGGQGFGTNNTNGLRFLTNAPPGSTAISGMQNWFKSVGVELAEPGRAIFYSDRKGMLMVRSTLEDLDVIEKAFQPFGVKPGAGVSPRSASELTNSLSAGQAATSKAADLTDEIRIETARLVQDGKLSYEAGRLEAARTNLQAALRLEPMNQGAKYYLDLVQAQLAQVRLRVGEAKLEPEQEWTEPVNRNTNRNGTATITNPNELRTRFFRVDPNTLEQSLKSISTHDPRNGKKPVFNPNDTNSVIERVQRFLGAAGVDLSAPGRSLFYNDRVGTVMVRATSPELEVMEKAIQLLNMSPPQLTIRVKVLEVERKSRDGLGSDWFLGTIVTNAAPTGAPPASKAPVGKESDAIPASLLTSGLRTKAPEAGSPTITGILTDAQFRATIKALESRGGTDLLSAPEVTTMSGRQAQIKVVDIRYIVTDLDIGATNPKNKKPEIAPIAEPFELGPVIDVIPYVQADGYTIQMTVLPSLKEFLGYEDPKTVQPAIAGAAQANGVTQPMPLPKFRLRQVATTAMIWDGQTLMIGAGSARTMHRKPDASGVITTNYTEKELIYFITPRLIDAAGNPLHADDEFSERHKTVPTQRAQTPN